MYHLKFGNGRHYRELTHAYLVHACTGTKRAWMVMVVKKCAKLLETAVQSPWFKVCKELS